MINNFLANLRYDYQVLDDGTLMIVNYTGNASDLEVPSSIKHLQVSSIGVKAFSGCSSLKSIVIPNGVLSIGDLAFSDCENLSSIVLPESISSIGESAFTRCKSLTSITIPSGVTSIGDQAFSDCENLISIVLSDGVTDIGESVFTGCTSLKSIMVSDQTGKNYELRVPVKVKKDKPVSERYVCPYCGTKITPESILFWEKVKTTYADKVRGAFLRYHGVLWNQNDMFQRVYYKANEINLISEDWNGYPTMIEVDSEEAIVPADLKYKAFSVESVKRKEIENRKKNKEKSEFVDDFFEDDFDNYDHFDDDFEYFDDEDDNFDNDYDDLDVEDFEDSFDDGFNSGEKNNERKLHCVPMRACPYCHCELPQKFGMLETYHVAVLGGFASGKTAFLISLFEQLNTRLNENNLGSLILENESSRYLDPMIYNFKQFGTTIPTQKDHILPIVCRYENKEKEVFFVFHEIPTEGASDPEYYDNHEEIVNCDQLLLIIDSVSFDLSSYPIWKGDCWSGLLEDYLQTECKLFRSYFSDVRNVIAVVTKLDILEENKDHYSFPEDIELFRSLREEHYEAANLSVINRIDNCLQNNITNHSPYVDLKTGLSDIFGDGAGITLLGVSVKDDLNSDTNNRRSRIIEPFLVMLMQMGLIPFKNSDNRIIWSIKDVNRHGSSEYPEIIEQLAAMLIPPEESEQADEFKDNEASDLDDFDF